MTELKVDQIREGQIVFSQKQNDRGKQLGPIPVTITTIKQHFVILVGHANGVTVNVFCNRLENGRLTDDSGIEILLYEYPGQPLA